MKIQYGITGNYYITSDKYGDVAEICKKIGKSVSSIRKKEDIYVARVKAKHHKDKLKIIKNSM